MSCYMILPLLLFLTLNINMFFFFSHLYFSGEVWHIDDLNSGVCFELLASQPELYVQILVFLHLPLDSLHSCLNTSTVFHPNECVCKLPKINPFLKFHMTMLFPIKLHLSFFPQSHRGGHYLHVMGYVNTQPQSIA